MCILQRPYTHVTADKGFYTLKKNSRPAHIKSVFNVVMDTMGSDRHDHANDDNEYLQCDI